MSEAIEPMAAAPIPAKFLPTESARVAWIDVARGCGMLLVIVGHAAPKASPPLAGLGKWIYSFHMPLFFFLSGLLIREQVQAQPWGRVIVKAARSLLLPYLVFGVFAYLVWVLALRHFGQDAEVPVPVAYPLGGLAYGTFIYGLDVLNSPVWFFPCLFCTVLFHRSLPVHAEGQVAAVAVFFVCGLACLTFLPWRLPWGLDLAAIALLFFYLGQRLRPWLLQLSASARRQCLLTVPLLLGLQLFCARVNLKVDLARGVIGDPTLFIFGALSGILATLFVVPFIPSSLNWLLGSWIGRNTLIIFPLHLFCFSAIAAAVRFSPFFKSYLFYSPAGTVILYTVLTLLGFVIVTPVVNGLFPWLGTSSRAPRANRSLSPSAS